MTQKLNLQYQYLKKVSVPIEIRPIVVVNNDKVEDDILCQKLYGFIVTSNIEVHVDVGELEKKNVKVCSLIKNESCKKKCENE